MELKLSPAERSVPTKRGLVLGVLYVLLVMVGAFAPVFKEDFSTKVQLSLATVAACSIFYIATTMLGKFWKGEPLIEKQHRFNWPVVPGLIVLSAFATKVLGWESGVCVAVSILFMFFEKERTLHFLKTVKNDLPRFATLCFLGTAFCFTGIFFSENITRYADGDFAAKEGCMIFSIAVLFVGEVVLAVLFYRELLASSVE